MRQFLICSVAPSILYLDLNFYAVNAKASDQTM
jgi:hypothetical protein